MTARSVWAVTTGSYSDYRVRALFATRDLANLAIANAPGGSSWTGYDVEAFTLYDELPAPVTTWEAAIVIYDDGSVGTEHGFAGSRALACTVEAAWDMSHPERAVPVCWRWVRAPIYKDKGGRLEVSGTDQERVKRVLSDKRAEILATPSLRIQKEARG